MKAEPDLKQQIRDFYDQVGWQEISAGCYQNATYEDLRPVAREYIQRCHMRVMRHLKPQGEYFLDAGSGPVQYPEYLEYSRGYNRRVCVDISITALREARKRVGAHGLYVAADVANLPFKAGSFDGIVSLHTIHHLPQTEHLRAYQELFRLLVPGANAVVVNGWENPPLIAVMNVLMGVIDKLRGWFKPGSKANGSDQISAAVKPAATARGRGTYVAKYNAAWLKSQVGTYLPLCIWTWRSASVRFLRTFAHEKWSGRALLRGLFWLEERFPHFLGENGQYPLIVMQKK